MNTLFRNALLKADEIRMQLKLDMYQVLNIYDACLILGLSVRFVDINMEGMYVKNDHGTNPTILISNKRPFPRRCFTCAHELGHHVFGHGTKLDLKTDQTGFTSASKNKDEFLVDCFAGALLMPSAGILAEFAKRNWNPKKASPLQFFTICSVFGTGYKTLIVHCKANGIIDEKKAISLQQFTPIKILHEIFGDDCTQSYFKILDCDTDLSVIDLEVSNYIILPKKTIIEGNHLQRFKENENGIGYKAIKPGIVRAIEPSHKTDHFIRIQNANYVGLAEYRHLESEEN